MMLFEEEVWEKLASSWVEIWTWASIASLTAGQSSPIHPKIQTRRTCLVTRLGLEEMGLQIFLELGKDLLVG